LITLVISAEEEITKLFTMQFSPVPC
jgi:hypothetical protein